MKKPRVIIVYSHSFQPHEGWYRRAYNEAQALIEEGYEVTLLAWDRWCKSPEDEDVDGIRVHRFQIPAAASRGPANAPRHFLFSRAVYRYIRTHGCDVVHAFNVAALPVGLLAARRGRCKCVADICEPDNFKGFWPPRYNWLTSVVDRVEKTFASKFDRIFVHNSHQVEAFRSRGISHVIQAGSYPDRALLRNAPRKQNPDRVVVGRLGSVYARNGYEELIAGYRAFLQGREKAGDGRSFRLRLAGNVFENYQETFQALVKPVAEHVDMTGAYHVSELASLYEQIDISLLFYGKGAFGHVTPTKLFESMACGVPVVVSDTGDMPEIVRSADCGVVVDAEDPSSIRAGIETITADPDRISQMSANAIAAAREKYTWEAIKHQFTEPYRELVANG